MLMLASRQADCSIARREPETLAEGVLMADPCGLLIPRLPSDRNVRGQVQSGGVSIARISPDGP
jgi:hypothetical protein